MKIPVGCLILALVFFRATAGFTAVQEPHICLDHEQRRAAIANQQAIPLAKVARGVGSHWGGEIVKARLCQQNTGLIYELTVLMRDGKVMWLSIDALSGAVIASR